MKITSKGQVTIPQEFRERFGFLPNTQIEFIAERGALKLIKSRADSAKGKSLVDRMRGCGDGKLSTAQIMKLTRG